MPTRTVSGKGGPPALTGGDGERICRRLIGMEYSLVVIAAQLLPRALAHLASIARPRGNNTHRQTLNSKMEGVWNCRSIFHLRVAGPGIAREETR